MYPCEETKGRINKLYGCITSTGYGHVVTPARITCPSGNVVSCNAAVANKPLAYPGMRRTRLPDVTLSPTTVARSRELLLPPPT
jgi:hypothetical protein